MRRLKKETNMEHVISPSAQPLRLPFSQAVRAGDFLFLSGAIGASRAR